MIKKIKNTILTELKSGATPEKISQSLSFGILIGGFPLLGFTTGLGFLFGLIFKLNHLVVQTTNYLMYPVQLLLIPVYIKLVGLFLTVENVPVRPDLIYKLFNEDWKNFLQLYGLVGLYAVLLWGVVSFLLYFVLKRIFLIAISRFTTKIKKT